MNSTLIESTYSQSKFNCMQMCIHKLNCQIISFEISKNENCKMFSQHQLIKNQRNPSHVQVYKYYF